MNKTVLLNFISIGLIGLLNSPSYAADRPGSGIKKAFEQQQAKLNPVREEKAADSTPTIAVDESNFNSIYTSNLKLQSSDMIEKSNAFELEVLGRFVSIKEMGFNNPYFTVDYKDGMSDLPLIQIGGGKKFWEKSSFSLSGIFSGGYGFKESKLSIRAKQGAKLVDIVGLHVVPLTLGVEAKQKINFLKGTSVFTTPQVGALWLRQSGSLDGMEQNQWIYFYGVRAGLILFQPESKADFGGQWFDGVTASWTLQSSFGSEQKFDTTSVDIGLRLLL